jgi:hypothetical protein
MNEWEIMKTTSDTTTTTATTAAAAATNNTIEASAFLRTNKNVQVRIGNDEDGHSVTVSLEIFLDYMNGTKQKENVEEGDDANQRQEQKQVDCNPLLVFDSMILNHSNNTHWYSVPSIFQNDDLLQYLPSRPKYKWLIIGPQRSGSSMHQDPTFTNAWNALVSGYKHWILFHPETPSELLHSHLRKRTNGNQNRYWDDLFQWYQHDLIKIKKKVHQYFYDKNRNDKIIRCYEFLQKPGEIIYVPSMWHHAVLNVEDSLAITQNFIDRININDCYECMNNENLLSAVLKTQTTTAVAAGNDNTWDGDAAGDDNEYLTLQELFEMKLMEHRPDLF